MDGPDRPAHYNDIDAVERAAWDFMVRGALSRKSAFHQVTLATVDAAGLPQARTVVLRGADRAERQLRFHTDARSRKASELSASPKCSLLLYDHGAKVQVRVNGTAMVHAEAPVAEGIWQGMRDMSKACYRQGVAPGTSMDTADGAEGLLLSDADGYGNFVVVTVAVDGFEWLYLAAAGHRRAHVRYGSTPERRWLAP